MKVVVLLLMLQATILIGAQTVADLDTSIVKVKAELRSAQVELNELQRKYTAEYPAIVSTKQKIDQLKAELERLNKERPPQPVSKEKMTPLLMAAKIGVSEQLLRLCTIDPINDKCGVGDPAKDLADLYAECIKNAECSAALVAKTISDYTSLREGARSAVQVSQAADEYGIKLQMIQITQNQRIIDLLELLLRKKP